ncbi:hypothetical protein ACK8P5_17490 [Paenibacillus sp. EC2-1]|uniref:hypothetical protein n=1 Tax=Paenibacillus sp. EC2-1 TaxID=3388665 RepID=UPI003BEEFB68
MNVRNLRLKIATHSLLLAAIGYVLYLYMDLFLFVSDKSPDDGYRLYALITLVPVPIFVSLFINIMIERDSNRRRKIITVIHYLFPIGCIVLIPGQFLLFSVSDFKDMFIVCFGITVALLLLSIVLLINDLRHKDLMNTKVGSSNIGGSYDER